MEIAAVISASIVSTSVGIRALADTSVNALGLGHCRLVELARALAGQPKILLADEPSSGLDIHETAEVAKVLRQHGWAVPLQWTFVPRLWFAGGVLLLAGAAFAVAGRLRT